MRRRFRCQMRPNCRSQSGRRPWICSGGCNATCAATADGSRDNSGGDAAAGSIPPAPQLQMAVETKAVRCSGDCDIKCATTADSSRDGGGGDAAAAATPAAAQLPTAVGTTAVAMRRRRRCGGGLSCATTADSSRDDGGGDAAAVPAAAQLLTAVGTTAVAMRRRRRCGGGLDINCARTADGSQDEGGGNAAAAAKPAAPQRLTAVETTAMAMPAMPAIPPVSQLRPSCRRQSRGRRWRSGGRGDAATAAMTAAPHPQMALEMTAVAMQRRRRATCVTTADSSRDDGVAMWRRLRCHLATTARQLPKEMMTGFLPRRGACQETRMPCPRARTSLSGVSKTRWVHQEAHGACHAASTQGWITAG